MAASASPRRRAPEPTPEDFVILKKEDRLIVYRPSDPTAAGTVSGDQSAPTCTCETFIDSTDAAFRCEHILAAYDELDPPPPPSPAPAAKASALRAVPAAPVSEPKAPAPDVTLPEFLVLKRSVSPDGRIDSLSVELSVPVTGMTPDDVAAKADESLALQEIVAKRFLARPTNRSAAPPKTEKPAGRAKAKTAAAPKPAPTEDVPANTVLGVVRYVGTAKSPFGVNYTLSVQVEDERFRYFGSQKKVHAILTSLGSDLEQKDVVDGLKLQLPCRVTLVQKGEYTNVEAVFPPDPDDDIPF